jgi:hypothetical protein
MWGSGTNTGTGNNSKTIYIYYDPFKSFNSMLKIIEYTGVVSSKYIIK